MTASQTSRAAYANVAFDEWFDRIETVMRRDPERPWCIADLASEMNAEKSTISARLNEMLNDKRIERTEKMRSRTTAVLAYHYKLKIQPSLI